MTNHLLNDRERAVLEHLTPRRFELLLLACQLPQPFTAPELKALYSEVNPRTISLDLESLERGKIVKATPPADQPRRGQPIYFELVPDIPEVLERLASTASDAWSSIRPASET